MPAQHPCNHVMYLSGIILLKVALIIAFGIDHINGNTAARIISLQFYTQTSVSSAAFFSFAFHLW